MTESMNAMLEWLKEPLTQPVWLLLATAAVFWIVACYAIYRAMLRPNRLKIVSNLVLERALEVEKMIANLATTCADNTARLAGIEEYLQDKQLATAMFGRRPGESDRPIYLGPSESCQLGNVEFRAGDFPVVLPPTKDSQ